MVHLVNVEDEVCRKAVEMLTVARPTPAGFDIEPLHLLRPPDFSEANPVPWERLINPKNKFGDVLGEGRLMV